MSNLISATVQRRVVGSATRKSVLLYMADKAADDGSGIWTSKANIARDLELGVRAVQYAIRSLVDAGLLIEIGQRDCKHGYTVEYGIVIDVVSVLPSTRDTPPDRDKTASRRPADKCDSPPAPDAPHAPDAGVTPARGAPLPLHHVHPNHPMNLTTTPPAEDAAVDKSDPQARCLAAAGPGLCPASRAEIIKTSEVIAGWLQDGIDFDAVILPVIRARTTQIRISPIRTWGYFTDAVRAAHQQRLRQQARPQGAEKTSASPQLRFYADWVNADRYLPPSAITNATAHALLAAGLTTTERLAQRGVPIPAMKEQP
ncbi:helix-turn-helix domain-containing protein [Paracoccus jeotgali]|uniref:helix-turn-helix domain-containing protein n=1 Tax=Paracoccus jeotgali TaxID=2065379 RepID=UPI0013151F1A|nr:helix-turn-helix domain-containing protein [Paracoccus jeotgali]